MKKNLNEKTATFIATLLALVLAFAPVTAQAAPPPSIDSWVWTYDECQNGNLSEGTISWDDDLVSGQLSVQEIAENNGTRQFEVYVEEFYHINDMPNLKKKQIARRTAQVAFIPVRTAARNRGWWDCKWKIKSVSKTKVVAEAVVQYKSVRTGVNSKDVKIKQVTKKNKGQWKTTYKIGKKSYSEDNIISVF